MRLFSARDQRPHARRHSNRRLTCAALSAALAVAFLIGGFSAPNARASSVTTTTWKAQDASSAVEARLYSVAFADAAHGWAVGPTFGSDGNPTSTVILATANGGATWETQDISSAGNHALLSSVAFADATHGWAAGGNDTGPLILATSDGGTTWKAQDISNAVSNTGLYSVACVDATHAWAVGNVDAGYSPSRSTPVIFATSDGGTTWKAQDASSAGKAVLESVTFADPAHGWIVGSANDYHHPVILATSDGGATWRTQDTSSAGKASLGSVTSADAAHAWALGGNNKGPIILATSNGGATWKTQDISSAGDVNLESITFADAAHGWVVGDGGFLATTDGGATWSPVGLSTAGRDWYLATVASPDAAHAWAAGYTLQGPGETPIILAAHTTAVAGAASSKGVPWLIVAALLALALVAALVAALAIRRGKATGGAAGAASLAPDARSPIGDVGQPGATPTGGEKARFCTGCGSALGAGSIFCASCGAKVTR